jgi:hypothetical protein
MNRRTRTFWTPAFISLTGSMAWRLALQQTVGPSQKLLNHAGLPMLQQCFWLAALPVLGGLSAYLSRRAGGERWVAAAAALFPSILMIPLWMGLAVKMSQPSPSQWFGLLFGVLNWIVFPGVALLVGAVPFLNPQNVIERKIRMNTRTATFWLPALISLTGAMGGLTISTLLGLQPRFLLRDTSTLVVYVPWLLMLPLCGAAGAYFSRRGGGQRAARLAAGLFPVIAIVTLATFLTVVGKFTFAEPYCAYVLVAALVGIVLPAIALFVGAAPFMKATLLP